jgi:hypothetical protein
MLSGTPAGGEDAAPGKRDHDLEGPFSLSPQR